MITLLRGETSKCTENIKEMKEPIKTNAGKKLELYSSLKRKHNYLSEHKCCNTMHEEQGMNTLNKCALPGNSQFYTKNITHYGQREDVYKC